MREQRVAMFGQPVLPRGMYHTIHVADKANPTPQNMTIQSNRPAHTPERKSTWNYSHTNTCHPY